MLDPIALWEVLSISILGVLAALLLIAALRRYSFLRRGRMRAEVAEHWVDDASSRLRSLESELRKNREDTTLQNSFYEAERDLFRAGQEADIRRKRADRLSSGMYVFCSLAILAFIPVLLTLFLLKPSPLPNASTSVTVPVLEELARQGGRDLRALIEVLKDRPVIGTPGTEAPVVGGSVGLTWAGWASLALTLCALAGITCMLLGKMGIGLATTIPSLAILMLCNISFLKEGSLFGALFKFEGAHVKILRKEPSDIRQPVEATIVMNVFPWMEQPVQVVSASGVEFHCDTAELQLRVGTFISGMNDKLMEPDTKGDHPRNTTDDLRRKIESLYKGKTLVGLLLIGYADKDLPNEQTKQAFDTNHSLAQKRALWVEQELKAQSKANGDAQLANLSTVVVLGAPPKQVGAGVKSRDKEKDRIVTACVAVRSKS